MLFFWNLNLGIPILSVEPQRMRFNNFYLQPYIEIQWLTLCPRTAWIWNLTILLRSPEGPDPGCPTFPPAASWRCSLALLPSLCPTSCDCGSALPLLPHPPDFQPHRLWCVTHFYQPCGEDGEHLATWLRAGSTPYVNSQHWPWILSLCPTWVILIGQHRHPAPSSTFPDLSPLLRAPSKWHTNPSFFIIQNPAFFLTSLWSWLFQGDEVEIPFHHQKSPLKARLLGFYFCLLTC